MAEYISSPHRALLTGAEIVNRRHARDRIKYSPEYDERFHGIGDFVEAAQCYLTHPSQRAVMQSSGVPITWPWSKHEWHPEPGDRIEELAKAASLIMAEIDRLQREAIRAEREPREVEPTR